MADSKLGAAARCLSKVALACAMLGAVAANATPVFDSYTNAADAGGDSWVSAGPFADTITLVGTERLFTSYQVLAFDLGAATGSPTPTTDTFQLVFTIYDDQASAANDPTDHLFKCTSAAVTFATIANPTPLSISTCGLFTLPNTFYYTLDVATSSSGAVWLGVYGADPDPNGLISVGPMTGTSAGLPGDLYIAALKIDAVPEPSAIALSVLALGLMGVFGRRKA